MSRPDIMGVILAAGKGSRMAPFSSRYPKPLLPVCNKPILVHQIERMAELGIRDVVIVVGHLGYEIARVLGNGSQYGVSIRFVEQKEILGIAHAVSQLEKHVDRPFLLFLGDIFFDTDDLSVMIDDMREREAAAILAVKEERDPDAIRRNFAVILDDDGTVRRVIEKPRYIKNRLKGCGLYLFDLPIFDAIRRTPRTAMRDEYEITDSIQIMIDDGHRVYHSPVVEDDMNITFPEDLLHVNLMELRKRGLDGLVDPDVTVPAGADLAGSVIGAGVTFAHPLRLTNSLVFPGSRLSHAGEHDHIIVHGDSIIQCHPRTGG